MSQDNLPAVSPGSEPTPKAAPKGGTRWLLSLAVLSLLAVLTGGVFGLSIVSTVEKAFEEKQKSEQEKAAPPLVYSGNLALKDIQPVVANLRSSGELWIRLEASIVFTNGAVQNPDVMAAEIRQDILAYLRTLSVEQVEGASGLLHVREDLNERAVLRSKGLVRELIIQALIVQ